jgi:protein gp37
MSAKFNRTNENVDWAQWTWNPVTGCNHGCDYCYARDIAMRFEGHFTPTFHPERMTAPRETPLPKEGRRVFVGSMCDLFGSWVPKEWIEQVLAAVREAPEWTFLFLTKNPARYLDFEFPPNCWVGATGDFNLRSQRALDVFVQMRQRGVKTPTFLSCEPLLEATHLDEKYPLRWLQHALSWVIIGARSRTTTGPEKQPAWAWVYELLEVAGQCRIPVFCKDNLRVLPKEVPGA